VAPSLDEETRAKYLAIVDVCMGAKEVVPASTTRHETTHVQVRRRRTSPRCPIPPMLTMLANRLVERRKTSSQGATVITSSPKPVMAASPQVALTPSGARFDPGLRGRPAERQLAPLIRSATTTWWAARAPARVDRLLNDVQHYMTIYVTIVIPRVYA